MMTVRDGRFHLTSIRASVLPNQIGPYVVQLMFKEDMMSEQRETEIR